MPPPYRSFMDEAANIIRAARPADSELLVGRIAFQITSALIQLEDYDQLTGVLETGEMHFKKLATELEIQRLHPSAASLWTLNEAREAALEALFDIEKAMSPLRRHNGPVFDNR